MKTTSLMTNLLAALSTGLTSSVSAECFGSGETWSNVDAALANARTACNDNLKGSYNAGQVKSWSTSNIPFTIIPSKCINASGTNQRHDFRVRNTDGNSVHDLNADFCTFLLSREINGCSRGGRRTEGSWEVTSDPNAGSC